MLISHLHADHFLDLVPFSYALTYAPRQQPVPVGGWPGHEPPGPAAALRPGRRGRDVPTDRRLLGNRRPDRPRLLILRIRRRWTTRRWARSIRFCEVPHYTVTHAVDLASNGSRFTFSADCSPNDELVAFARDTDMLLIEATLPRPERTGVRGHLTAREAGEHGRRAGARRLVLTHYSDELDSEWTRAEAADSFGGPVEMALEGAVYTV